MKVLQITTHMNIGGIANYILTLSKALQNKGGRVVVASSGGNLEPELSRAGIRHMALNINTKFEFAPTVFFSIPELCRIIREEGIDIIHAHTRVSQVASFFASRITGVPYVTTCHGFFKTRLRKVFDTWGSMVIAISDSVKSHLIKDLGVDSSRIELVYSGVDVERFSRVYSESEIRGIKASIGISDLPVVGTIGRLSKVKGHAFLIEAMALILSRNNGLQVLLVGDGEEAEHLKTLAGNLKIEDSVHFVKSDVDTRRFLSVMDVFVFPSLKEGLGIALLEALAAGRACVASDIGGIKDIITDQVNGVLVGPGDAVSISKAVLSLIGDEALRKRMGEAGRELVKRRFALDVMADRVLGLYKEVLRSYAQG